MFNEAELVLGVKEPQPEEIAMLRPEHLLFTHLHLAPDPDLTRGLQESGATCVAYETVEDGRGRLPLLAPVSEVAGKIATQAGAFFLERPLGGRGDRIGGGRCAPRGGSGRRDRRRRPPRTRAGRDGGPCQRARGAAENRQPHDGGTLVAADIPLPR